MAGRGDRRFIDSSQATLRALLAAPYFNVNPECRTCRTGKKSCVHNFFCVDCKRGSLREEEFRNGGVHANHSSIRVWYVTYAFAVKHGDLRRFTAKALVDQVQKYKQNDNHLCKFFKSDRANGVSAAGSSSAVGSCRFPYECHGCRSPISIRSIPNYSRSPVCSLECLLDHTLAQRVNFLIAAIDSMPGDEWEIVTPANDNSDSE